MLIEILKERNVCGMDVRITSEIYSRQKAFMTRDEHHKFPLRTKRGVRQGHILSPVLFNAYADEMMKRANPDEGVVVYGDTRISKISYADDIVLLAESAESLEAMINKIATEGKNGQSKLTRRKLR